MNSNIVRRAIAHHEAGHAVIGWCYAKPGGVRAVLLTSDNAGSAGFTYYDLAGAAPWQRYAVNIAGPLAAAVFAAQRGVSITSEPPSEDAGADLAGLREALENAGAAGLNDDREPVYTPESLVSIEAGARPRSIEAKTLALLRRHWAAVEAVAVTLEAHGRIGPRQLTQIMRRHGVERQRL